ncbi:MAG TPA: hypothetical protein PLV64_22450 [Anaerolineales bacterium]|nr:hypothetical protein [Anaerolineales bacterium]
MIGRTATSRNFSLDLNAIGSIKLPQLLQVQRRGEKRLPTPGESLAIVLGALGTLNRSSGVKTLNARINGKPVAMALIEDARFGEDAEGNTTLDGLDLHEH